VEDAAAGIEAGKAGGFHTLGLGPHERVRNADIILDSLKGVQLQTILNLLAL
jgi:beta-phosphoglucomutase-like phosphatase (HAD superfamily)